MRVRRGARSMQYSGAARGGEHMQHAAYAVWQRQHPARAQRAHLELQQRAHIAAWCRCAERSAVPIPAHAPHGARIATLAIAVAVRAAVVVVGVLARIWCGCAERSTVPIPAHAPTIATFMAIAVAVRAAVVAVGVLARIWCRCAERSTVPIPAHAPRIARSITVAVAVRAAVVALGVLARIWWCDAALVTLCVFFASAVSIVAQACTAFAHPLQRRPRTQCNMNVMKRRGQSKNQTVGRT
eukprot:SAG31_NODE_6871_length_1864_cov_13.669122_1_plen_241_part_00